MEASARTVSTAACNQRCPAWARMSLPVSAMPICSSLIGAPVMRSPHRPSSRRPRARPATGRPAHPRTALTDTRRGRRCCEAGCCSRYRRTASVKIQSSPRCRCPFCRGSLMPVVLLYGSSSSRQRPACAFSSSERPRPFFHNGEPAVDTCRTAAQCGHMYACEYQRYNYRKISIIVPLLLTGDPLLWRFLHPVHLPLRAYRLVAH